MVQYFWYEKFRFSQFHWHFYSKHLKTHKPLDCVNTHRDWTWKDIPRMDKKAMPELKALYQLLCFPA